ncbi:hypothetical protein CW751_07390 [Brumimicrobium salinarum]|uniref:ComEC/Rec2-related protein domain-containing protein n=1 Tax=Brumimicrobium salinarum TaxID=2058658 RepID=A0A2I0R324_9FLAO|nr:ComEC/Rec2 family competence protein [Brumimicrobium salinarum]PKR80981.1 hypothetical protein CW751_07390 [Brumimicrobium salinarum]
MLSLHWVIIFTFWITSLICLIILNYYGRQVLYFKKWLTRAWLIVFLFSGALGYQFQLPTSYAFNFSNHFLENDQLQGEIIEYQKGKGKYDKAILEVNKIISPYREIKVQGKLLCYIRTLDTTFSEGQIIMVHPQIIDIKNKHNPGEFDAEKYWNTKGIQKMVFLSSDNISILGVKQTFSSWWTRSRNYLKQLIKDNIKPEHQGLVIALSLGDKSDLSNEKRELFANAGAMHVLAVSGMHVGILLWFIKLIFRSFKPLRNRNTYLYFAIGALWCFAFLTGMSASVTRAVTMFSILGVGQLIGKRFFSLQAIFASAFILIIFNPLIIYDIGFQLSYLAVLGISAFYYPILNLFGTKYTLINWLWEGSAIGIAAQIGTVPISLYYFNQFPNYFFITNIGLLVLAFVAFIGVILFFVFHLIPFVADGLILANNFIFDTLSGFIAGINQLPGEVSKGFTPNLLHVFVLYLLILAALYFWKKMKLKQFNLTTVFLFVAALMLIFQREYNKSKSELVILNHYKKVILIKENRKLFIVQEENNKIKEDDLAYLVNGYEQRNGVVGSRLSIPIDKELSLRDDIRIRRNSSGIKIEYHDQKYFLAQNMSKIKQYSDYKIIAGNWNPWMNEELADFSTKERALIIKP